MAYQIMDTGGTSHTITPLQARITASVGQIQQISITIPSAQLNAIQSPYSLIIEGRKGTITDIERGADTARITAGSVNPGLAYTRITPISQANNLADYLRGIASAVQGEAEFLGLINLTANPLTADLGISSVFSLIVLVAGLYGKSVYHYTDSAKDRFIVADPPTSYDADLAALSCVQDCRKEQYSKAIITKTAGMVRYSEAIINPNQIAPEVTSQGLPYLLGTYAPLPSTCYDTAYNGRQYRIDQLRAFSDAFSQEKTEQDPQNWYRPVEALAFAPAYESPFVFQESSFSTKIENDRQGVCTGGDYPARERFIGGAMQQSSTETTVSESLTKIYYGSVGKNTSIYTETDYRTTPPSTRTEGTTTDPLLTQHDSAGVAKADRTWGGSESWPDGTGSSTSGSSTTGAEINWLIQPSPLVFPWCHLCREITSTDYDTETTPGSTTTRTWQDQWSHVVSNQPDPLYNGTIWGTADNTEKVTISPTVTRTLKKIVFGEAKYSSEFDATAIPTIFPAATPWQLPLSSQQFFDPTVNDTDTNTKMNGLGIVGQYTYRQGIASYPYELQPSTRIAAITAKWLSGESMRAYARTSDFDICLLPGIRDSKIPIHVQMAEASQLTFSTEKQASPDPKTYVLTGTVWESKADAMAALPGVLYNQRQGTLTTIKTPYSPGLWNMLGRGATVTVNGNAITGQITYISADILSNTAEVELKTA